MLLTKTDQEDFQKKVREAIEASFSGWDFSYINEYGGKPELICPWNYEKKVRDFIPESHSLLDLGTGGGEFLSTLKPFPEKVIATEAYKPNVKIARDKLNPLGIEVVLENIYYLIKRDGYFEDICHRFLIIAQKL